MENNKKTILVLEDEDSLLKIIRTKLTSNGFEVLIAKSVDEALGHIQSYKKIDCIWLDHYLLGQKNGLDLVTQLKHDLNYQKIPIFVVSNTASPEKVAAYIELGIKNYYTKANTNLDKIIGDIKESLKGAQNE
jgi:CheY-like chemotaxis protein